MHILYIVSWRLHHSPQEQCDGNSFCGVFKELTKMHQENPGFGGQSLLLFYFNCYSFLISWMTRLLVWLTQRAKTLARHIFSRLDISY